MKLLGIATRDKNQHPMQLVQMATVTLSEGIEHDFRRKPGRRQVTVLSKQQWQQACDDINLALPWTIRRANLLLDNIIFKQEHVGKTLKIGDSLELLICLETEPCHKMDQQHHGLRQALTPDWRGGVCCKVTKSGEIKLGDKFSII
ncbi:MOSC domain-containing protein [Aliiglaciecola sp. LCG003]|uniref:MOSC domain-containing protein n=1 Tax=Aliiglaciecola sp. LCG003 TaxID=3053655 RepID=UPI00257265D9|nr:MOSC domain-containing protein [Aliiglaciecola sp. LCG003]WJG11096.1 molybdenum cofactor biosysynthesis protein [Aliiglaciecola sp. LCG003]